MRGSPLLQAALVVIALLLLLIPLHRLTERHAVTIQAATTPPPAKEVHLSVRTTATPCRFQIAFLGKPLWAGDASTADLGKDFEIDFPKEGIDLAIDATWETQALSAIEISVSLPDGGVIAKTLWGQGTASDVLTFKEE